jgi:hypothetical protein
MESRVKNKIKVLKIHKKSPPLLISPIMGAFSTIILEQDDLFYSILSFPIQIHSP